MHQPDKFAIPSIRDFVPDKIRPYIIIFTVLIFQFSGGVYLAAISNMTGSLALIQEDIMMAGYASLIGMAIMFPVLLRLKFRFPQKGIFITCLSVLIACNILSANTSNVPILITICFVAGMFRMWGTFECMSTIQLWLTPTRDLSIFFCFIQLVVQGSIQTSGITTVHMAYIAKWEYMHLLVIALLSVTMLMVIVLFRSYRSMRKLPLYGIDWLGAMMWATAFMCATFICVYGEHYDWWQSQYIRFATVSAIILIGLNVWRASFIRHPYYNNHLWGYRVIPITISLLVIADFLLAPAHSMEHILIETLLHYDQVNLISLNWVVLAGIVVGCLFTWRTFALKKWTYRSMTVIAFSLIAAYLTIFYFTVDYNLPKSMLVLPLFLRGIASIIISIVFLTALTQVPFEYFFHGVSVQNAFSACLAGAIGNALLGRMLKINMGENLICLSGTIDRVNLYATRGVPSEVFSTVSTQAIAVTLKEVYGWLAITAFAILVVLFAFYNGLRPRFPYFPKYRNIRRAIKRMLRLDGVKG